MYAYQIFPEDLRFQMPEVTSIFLFFQLLDVCRTLEQSNALNVFIAHCSSEYQKLPYFVIIM